MTDAGLGFDVEQLDKALFRAKPAERAAILDGLRHQRDGRRRTVYRASGLAAFATDCIEWPNGESLAGYQADILDDVSAGGRVAGRSPHGAGKTGLASLAILGSAIGWDQEEVDWKIPTTASAWSQLQHYLWPEVHKWARMLRWDRLGRDQFVRGRELLVLSLSLRFGAVFSASPSEPAKIEGAHADRLLVVYDESKAVPRETFEATEGAFSGAGPDTGRTAAALAISTPGEPVGTFYDICAHKPGFEEWRTHHVTLEMAIAAGRISRSWADARERQWGRNSAIFQNRVLGEFASSEEEGVIPLAWVEAANRRWLAMCPLDDYGRPDPAHWQPVDPFTCVGVDVARGGADQTVMALRFGDAVGPLRYTHREDTMQTSGRVVGVLHRYPSGYAVVDVIGIGAGVYDRVREREGQSRVRAFNASEATKRRDRSGEFGFRNMRACAAWTMRELLDPAYGSTLALPPDDLLTGDLVAPHYRVLSGGVIQVESKEDIHKRIGRSTDSGDACLPAGTLVSTDRGPVAIEQVRVGDRVATRRGLRPVVWSGLTGHARSLVELVVGDRRLRLTADHPVLTADGWRPADTVVKYDQVLCEPSLSSSTGCDLCGTPIRPADSIGSTSGRASPFATRGSAASTKRSGRRTTDPSRPDITSTTRTRTRSTTPSPTWNASRRKTTRPDILDEATSRRNTWPPSGSERLSGIGAMRVASGTEATPNGLWLFSESQGRAFASNVESSSRPPTPQVPTSVLDDAGCGEPNERSGTTCPRCAQYAGQSSCSTRDVRSPLLVPGVVAASGIIRSAEPEPVFNLTVAGLPEFVAEGILVHNCVQAFHDDRGGVYDTAGLDALLGR